MIDELFSAAASGRLGDHRPRSGRTRCRGYRRRRAGRLRVRNAMGAYLAVMVTGDFQECPPWNETLGPVRPRGAPNGLVLRGGRIVAEWGDTMRADMTFSVAKSYLAILAGLAWDHGLIGDPDEPVCATVEDGGFNPPHNNAITWHHLL